MKQMTRNLLCFVGPLFAGAFLFSIFVVYVLGSVEPRWGKGGSAQVWLWAYLVCASIPLVLFSVLVWVRPNRFAPRSAAFIGLLVSIALFIALSWLAMK
jgi:uncharacterized BrkB/YihY/UPF0761 family membrane protein